MFHQPKEGSVMVSTAELHDDPFDLERFLRAQEPVYATVMAELRNARKETHWMWFIFPQIVGLGTSPTSQHFAIKNLDEARAYFHHSILGQRLVWCADELVAIQPSSPDALFIKSMFGFPDDVKLHASMTLFDYIAPSKQNVFAAVLDAYFQGKPHDESLVLIRALEEKQMNNQPSHLQYRKSIVQEETSSETQRLRRFRGCLLGGAAGDALGHPVEFLRIEGIRTKYGVHGIRSYAGDTGGLITDDTQMTLFTAEGLLRASVYLQGQKALDDDSRRMVRRFVHSAYLRWNKTQSGIKRVPSEKVGLLTLPEMFVRRAPGNTCLSALAQTSLGLKAMNDSKGCGGVMRVAPVGLLYSPEEAFRLGCETAEITHGHRTGILSAGFLAMTIALLLDGMSLRKAIYKTSRFMMDNFRGYEETLNAVNLALEYAEKTEHSERTLAKVGQGWIAEEALAIGLYCALVAGDDFERGITLAVNHDGDSDSTGSISGQILGVMLGESSIPAKFLERLELSALIGGMAEDLFIGYRDDENWREKYPEEMPG